MKLLRSARRIIAGLVCSLLIALSSTGADAQSFVGIQGEGSTFAQIAIEYVQKQVLSFGIKLDYTGNGSTNGRKAFLLGTTDFAASDIPFQFKPTDGSPSENPTKNGYAYTPVVAGGTAFMYNLKINGRQVTNLRLSGENVAKIFTGVITSWNDPALLADNPGLVLPDRKVVPVVRSDGSGTSAQFSMWMSRQHAGIWNDYCRRTGAPGACGSTSNYPTLKTGMISKPGDDGVSNYVKQSYGEGTIGYTAYAYPFRELYPVAKVLNAAGYYTESTPENVAVSLLKAKINNDSNSPDYLTQQLDDVYTDPDPRNYPLSAYSYYILRTQTTERFDEAKGRTVGAVAYYTMCQAQEASASLGYSPIPINLVKASFEQIRKIPGVAVQDIDVSTCKNPTFSPDGTNLVAQNAPQPQDCDKKGPSQCATGTGGARSTPTALRSGGGAQAAGAGGAGGSGSGGASQANSGAGGAGAGGAGGAGTGAGAAGTGGATVGSGPDATTGSEACDPDTGVCGPGGGSVQASAGRTAAGGAGEQAVASSTVLAGSSGRAGYALLIALILLLTLALIFAPAAAWQYFSHREQT